MDNRKLFAVAYYILLKTGKISTMKLQKLMYYCQCWSLVWDERPMFDNTIEAWINGPVIVDLYHEHQGLYYIEASFFEQKDKAELTPDEKDTIDSVVDYYGKKSPQELSDLTHAETPWREARKGLSPFERGNHPITLESMAEYYESIQA